MGTISSSMGLISGMDIEGIVTQLMEIESRPKQQLETRMEELTERQTAMMKVQALVMSVQISAAGFNKDSIFQNKAVSSSNEDIITATGNKFAVETARTVAVIPRPRVVAQGATTRTRHRCHVRTVRA